jgi:signal transduction histidine kinase
MEYEYWTERANSRERESALGQTWPMTDYKNFFNAVLNNWPELQTLADADLLSTEKAALEFWDGKTALVVPVMLQDKPIGFLEIWDSSAIRQYDKRTQRVLLTIANQVAVQLENIRLVNELKETLARSQELATAAESANRLKTEFIANISHELRTPLTAIQGGLGLVLQETVETRDEEKYWLNVAYQGSENLLKLINALLSVAKIEASQVQLMPTAVDVSLLIREVEGHTRPAAEMKDLTYVVEIAEFTHWAWLDYERARQILLSLLQNAVKFTEAGTITLRAWQEGAELLFVVQDTGIGIMPEVRTQLFRPFAQGDGSTTRRYGGFGMGLYTAQRLAELMGGYLEIYSAGEGLGTTVTLHLPWRLAETELALEALIFR